MSVLVYQDKAIALAVGVDWSVLASGREKVNASAIRKRAAMIGAKKYCTTRLQDTTFIGLYTPPIVLPGVKAAVPKKIHSLAIVFRNAFSNVDLAAINAVLLMAPQDAQDAKRMILVVIEGGQVVYNKIDETAKVLTKAREFTALTGIAYSVFGNTNDLPSTEVIQWVELIGYANNQSELKSIPINKMALGLFALVATLVAAGLAYNFLVLAPAKARARLLEQQAANNHTPQYLERLNAGLTKAGWDHADLLGFVQSLKTQAVYQKGWELKKIDCNIDSNACEYKYARLGGTLKELIAIASASDKSYQAGKTISVAEANFSQKIKPLTRSLRGVSLPKPELGNITLRNQVQHLLNAGTTVNTTENKAWPVDGIDINKVEATELVKRGGFELKAPYALTETVLSQLPVHVVLRGFVVDFNVGGDKAENIKMTFKGHSYVK